MTSLTLRGGTSARCPAPSRARAASASRARTRPAPRRPPPVGARQRRPLPHPRPQQRRHRPRHRVDHRRTAATAPSRASSRARSPSATARAAATVLVRAGHCYLAPGAEPRRGAPRLRMLLTAGALAAARRRRRHGCAGVLDAVENGTLDQRFQLRGAQRAQRRRGRRDRRRHVLRPRAPVAVPALAARAGDRPAARGRRARDRLRRPVHRADAAEREDLALYDAIGRAGGAILATTRDRRPRRHERARRRREPRARSAPRAAAAQPARRARRRHPPLPAPPSRGLTTLAVAVAERLGARPRAGVGVRRRRRLDRLPRRARARSAPSRSRRLLDGEVDPRRLRGKIVVVGADRADPPGRPRDAARAATPMSGPEIQANAIWTALHGLPLRDAPRLAGRAARRCSLALAVPLLRAARAASLARARRAGRSGVAYVGDRAARLRRAAWCCRGRGAAAGARVGTVGDDRRQLPARERRAPADRARTTTCSSAQRPRAHRGAARRRSSRSSSGSARRPSRATTTPARTSSGSARLCQRLALAVGLARRRGRADRHAARAARRRQDRDPRPRPAQARQARRRRVGASMQTPHADRRRDPAPGSRSPLLQLGRGDRAHPPRALGRQRLPGRPRRRGDPARRRGSARSATSSTDGCRAIFRCVAFRPRRARCFDQLHSAACSAPASRSPCSALPLQTRTPSVTRRLRPPPPPALPGRDACRIAYAINAASDGDEVVVATGDLHGLHPARRAAIDLHGVAGQARAELARTSNSAGTC